MTHQQDLIARAAAVLPGGVLGSHRSGSGLEFVVKDARGASLWDADGRRYIDCLLGSGPMRLTRGMLLEVLRQDYVRTAWAKGLDERFVVFKHSLKNAIIPVVTILGIQLAQIFSGTVIIESIFGLPGMGRFLFDAILQRDYPVIQGINLLVVSVIVCMNLLVDMLYAVLDPRIRYS